MDTRRIGANLRIARTCHGLTVRGCAELFGVTREDWRDAEFHGDIEPALLAKVTEKFKLPDKYFGRGYQWYSVSPDEEDLSAAKALQTMGRVNSYYNAIKFCGVPLGTGRVLVIPDRGGVLFPQASLWDEECSYKIFPPKQEDLKSVTDVAIEKLEQSFEAKRFTDEQREATMTFFADTPTLGG